MLFNDLFRTPYGTVLIRGNDEPEYLPASGQHSEARVIFAHGFYASALHEISHWCIAGPERRKLPDYGYWYSPDGRSAQQQAEFEAVEVAPQAIESLFSQAADFPFRVSIDNLSGCGSSDEAAFTRSVERRAVQYVNEGLPERASLFLDTLLNFYGTREAFLRRWCRHSTFPNFLRQQINP